jgi:pSer/pThr/pTyr-binding forkhead associated (FHA) protein
MAITTLVLRAQGGKQRVVIDALPAFIGRSPAAEVCVADDQALPFHCLLEAAGSRFVIADLGSASGTYVNGRCIRTMVLLPGDRITIGQTNFIVEYGR